MATTEELTYADVSEHKSKKAWAPRTSPPRKRSPTDILSGAQDLYLVIHDKVYNATTFVDEHPYVSPPPCTTHENYNPQTPLSPHPRLYPESYLHHGLFVPITAPI